MILEYLAHCEKIAESIGDVYRAMAESVPCNDRMRGIWQQLAKDEDDHALQVRFALRLHPKDVLESQRLTTEAVDRFLHRVQSILQGMEELPMTEKGALRLSRQLEEDFHRLHVASVELFRDQKMKDMFRCLARQDDDHAALLKKYDSEVYGD